MADNQEKYVNINGKKELFIAEEYLRSNFDVRKSTLDAYSHWINFGFQENRKISFKKEFEEYQDKGYFIIKNSIQKEIIDDALNLINQFKEDNITMWRRNSDSNGFVRRITNFHMYSEKIMKLF